MLNELLCEEQQLATQASLAQKASSVPINVAFAARVTPQGRDMSKVQCYSRQKYGHVATKCNQKNCT